MSVTLFSAKFFPSPCHTSLHIPRHPPKVRHTSRTPPAIFRRPSTKNPDKSPLVQILSQLFAGLCPGGFVRGSFVWQVLSGVVFVHSRKLNITLNFMFRMYDKKNYKCDITCSLPPPPVTSCHTFSDPLPPRA